MRACVLLCAALWALGCEEGKPGLTAPADLAQSDLAMTASDLGTTSDGGTTNPGLPRLTLTQGNGIRALAGGGHTLQLLIGQPVGSPITSGSRILEPGLMPQTHVP